VPELQFKGKEFVYNHHLTVPFRPLEMQADKSIGDARLDGNLIVHGDNLHALKALLPMYAGKVDCIFIDPPYNTGNEGWAYNDNVNSPMIREWLNDNPIGLEDGLRHDKWACMMWPRLKLLHELLAEDGSLWMTLDDNEVATGLAICDEIFGRDNRLSCAIWEKADSPRMDAHYFSSRHDFLLSYAKSLPNFQFNTAGYTEDDTPAHYDRLDGERRYYLKPLRSMGGQGESRAARPNLYFGMTAPDESEVFPKLQDGSDGTWRWSPGKVEREKHRIEWLKTAAGWTPYFRIYADESTGRPPETIFFNKDVGSSRTAKAQIKALFPEGNVFDTPKPVGLLSEIVRISVPTNGLTLDSFAGSGTTAHAVLAANARDGGNRRFILVEGEDYADTLTAERVRRVINGYAFTGTQRKELLREPITFSKLKQANSLLEKVQAIEMLDGPKYDRIAKTVKDGALIVTGERDVAETTPGLGGTFTYCTLGAPIEMDAILSGEGLPTLEAMAGLLWHTATATPFAEGDMVEAAQQIGDGVFNLGVCAGRTYWLFYKPDLDWLKSAEAALSLSKARAIAASAPGNHMVFAPAKFVSRELLGRERIDVDYAPLPFALYRLETA
jgi:adenine-specific DNA-methyltransferase